MWWWMATKPGMIIQAHPWLHSSARKDVPLSNLSVDATLPWCPAHGLAAHLAAMERIVPRHCPFEKIPGKFFGGSHLEVAAR
jgi:hypothetical protein